ncbi:MAG: sugar phosphate nucleotidyltransferase [Haloferacaceae archaeon]
MEAVVLAGGYATRLWPITRHRPKMFLPLGDETVIDTVLADLEADDRIESVYVSTNERFADAFADFLDGSRFEKPELSVEGTTAEDEKLGVVGALADLVEREGVTDDLLVVAGDNLISFDLAEFVDFFRETGTATLAAYDVGSRERASSYGVLDLDGDRVVGFQEKPDEPRSTLVSIACYAFPAATLDRFEEYLAADENPDEPGWFVQWLQARRPVHAFTFDGSWFDIGTPESYLDAVAWALDGEAHVAPDARVAHSTLGPSVQVLDGAEVTDARLERTVVFPDATVSDCAIDGSLVDERVRVENVDLTGALVGTDSRIVDD